MQSSLSIVMCTYNGAAFVEAQVQSIIGTNVSFEELVIVDDAFHRSNLCVVATIGYSRCKN
jgi:GT2 family glycosyltransferase